MIHKMAWNRSALISVLAPCACKGDNTVFTVKITTVHNLATCRSMASAGTVLIKFEQNISSPMPQDLTYSGLKRLLIFCRHFQILDENVCKCSISFYIWLKFLPRIELTVIIVIGNGLALTHLLPSATYMQQWIGSALVQIMACRLFGAKPLSQQMKRYC